jgi:hypothetical protein
METRLPHFTGMTSRHDMLTLIAIDARHLFPVAFGSMRETIGLVQLVSCDAFPFSSSRLLDR